MAAVGGDAVQVMVVEASRMRVHSVWLKSRRVRLARRVVASSVVVRGWSGSRWRVEVGVKRVPRAGMSMQAVERTATRPAGQAEQVVELGVVATVVGEHGEQVVALEVGLKREVGQAVQEEEPGVGVEVPGGQGVQEKD